MKPHVFLSLAVLIGFTACNRLAAPKTPAMEQAKVSEKSPLPEKKAEPAPEEKKKRQPKLSTIGRRMEIPETTNLMRNLGLAYKNYEVLNGKAPQKWQDLKADYENNPKISEALENGWWILITGVRPAQFTQGASNTIFAYEADADVAGFRVVLMGDGSIQRFDEAEFQKTPKAGMK